MEEKDDTSVILEGPLQRILDFKRNAKKVCKNKTNFLSKKYQITTLIYISKTAKQDN